MLSAGFDSTGILALGLRIASVLARFRRKLLLIPLGGAGGLTFFTLSNCAMAGGNTLDTCCTSSNAAIPAEAGMAKSPISPRASPVSTNRVCGKTALSGTF